jgi:succinylglutamic semialdehyde dehydrogenase
MSIDAHFVRTSPVDGSITWSGTWAKESDIVGAIERSEQAVSYWSTLPLEERCEIANRFAFFLIDNQNAIARSITLESGKPLWESLTEVQSSAGKVAFAIEAIQARRWTTSKVTHSNSSVIRYRPLGPVVVLGPFNLPLHLPGAHTVPALLAGNTVLFKPSDKSPAVGDWIQQAWSSAGLPEYVLQTIHGGPEQAKSLVSSPKVSGVFFTGSYNVGLQLSHQLAGRPECLLALEMGGNNTLVVESFSDQRAALQTIIQSAYITSGQRCTCARRLVLVDHEANRRLLSELVKAIPRIRCGDPFAAIQPFLGSLVSNTAADLILDAQEKLIASGAEGMVPSRRVDGFEAMLSPGLLLRSPSSILREEDELFGPLLSVTMVPDMDSAIEISNRTRYGLSAGIVSQSRSVFEHFVSRVRAGIINWNGATTGASGQLPFGGLGASGNHRSSGFFAADYCSDPIASIENGSLASIVSPATGLEEV